MTILSDIHYGNFNNFLNIVTCTNEVILACHCHHLLFTKNNVSKYAKQEGHDGPISLNCF